MAQPYRLGLDIGGTFTDFVLTHTHSDSVQRYKYLTSYPDPADGVVAGLQALLAEAAIDAASLVEIVHSTTLVTNAIIDRRGVQTGLLTTAGFRHILDLGREQRYDTYDLFLTYPEPLVPLHLRREVAERNLADGGTLTPVDIDAALAAVDDLIDQGIESLAIVFLHSYANSGHEEAVAEAIYRRHPQLPLSLSSQVAPVVGEWERTSTTVADAYVRPLVDRYLSRLSFEFAALDFRGRFSVMLSNGGAGSVETARRFPIRLLESGPSAGALAAREIGRRLDQPNLLAFDMGGTTAKACLVDRGNLYLSGSFEAGRVNRFKRGSGLPIAVPSVDLIEIGAGGGSIARCDALGLLQVGPHSAAAEPGPACYNRGGTQPTVTDANLLLGYLDSDYFLGGRMRLDRGRAEQAVGALAADLEIDLLACSWGIHQVVNENMAAAARMHVIEHGHDPRRFLPVASGGAGPAHVAAVARLLGAAGYVVPAGAGTFSSFGCLAAPFAFAFERTVTVALADLDWGDVQARFDAMDDEATALLTSAGIDSAAIVVDRSVDMRMIGQIHTIRVPIEPTDWHEADTARVTARVRERYHSRYEQLFARTNRHMPLECVNWHLVARSNPPEQAAPELDVSLLADVPMPKGRRPVYFPTVDGFVETPVYDRYGLAAGQVVEGPAIVEERESTTVLYPGDHAQVHPAGHLLVTFDNVVVDGGSSEMKVDV